MGLFFRSTNGQCTGATDADATDADATDATDAAANAAATTDAATDAANADERPAIAARCRWLPTQRQQPKVA